MLARLTDGELRRRPAQARFGAAPGKGLRYNQAFARPGLVNRRAQAMRARPCSIADIALPGPHLP